MENNRVPQYEQGCSPGEIGNIPRDMYPYEKRDLVKKIIKRQIAEYQVGIFTIDPTNYRWNLISKPYLESPSLPNNYMQALAYVHEHQNQGAPEVEVMADRNDNSEEPVIPDVPTVTEVFSVPIVNSVLYEPIRGRINTLVFNEDQINALRLEQDNWLYDNINYINKIELVCNPKSRCCLSITLTAAFISLFAFGLGGKRMKSKRKTKKGRNKKTKRKSNKSLKKFRPNIKSNRKKRGSCKMRSTSKK